MSDYHHLAIGLLALVWIAIWLRRHFRRRHKSLAHSKTEKADG